MHRRNPILHLAELELATYDREYAPAAERAAAWAEHLAAWPRVVDAAIESLDQVNAPVARALLGAARGLAAGIGAEPGVSPDGGEAWGTGGFGGSADEAVREAALAAHARLVAHLERTAAEGDPDPSLGGPALSALMSSAEALPVDLGRLAEQADAERDRLLALLAEGCAYVAPGRGPGGSPGTGPRASGRGGRDRRGPAMGAAGHRLHPRTRPGPLPRRGSAWSAWRPSHAAGRWR